jgi:hypothetical protein
MRRAPVIALLIVLPVYPLLTVINYYLSGIKSSFAFLFYLGVLLSGIIMSVNFAGFLDKEGVNKTTRAISYIILIMSGLLIFTNSLALFWGTCMNQGL